MVTHLGQGSAAVLEGLGFLRFRAGLSQHAAVMSDSGESEARWWELTLAVGAMSLYNKDAPQRDDRRCEVLTLAPGSCWNTL